MSNLTFLMILEHFFCFLTYIRQLFPMLSRVAKDKNPLILTNFFMLFHLAGVLCLALDSVMNFWHDLGVKLQKSDQK